LAQVRKRMLALEQRYKDVPKARARPQPSVYAG